MDSIWKTATNRLSYGTTLLLLTLLFRSFIHSALTSYIHIFHDSVLHLQNRPTEGRRIYVRVFWQLDIHAVPSVRNQTANGRPGIHISIYSAVVLPCDAHNYVRFARTDAPPPNRLQSLLFIVPLVRYSMYVCEWCSRTFFGANGFSEFAMHCVGSESCSFRRFSQ
jgi:hypothetical protein